MNTYKKESHLRSLLKGFSWRILATTDTILVVLLVTCFSGNCSIENALKIGFLEFLLKFVVYYIHERIWQEKQKDGNVNTRDTLYKTISWRIVATTMTFIIAGTVLEVFNEFTLYIVIIELFTKFALYYFHERLWLRLPLGKIRNFFIKNKAK